MRAGEERQLDVCGDVSEGNVDRAICRDIRHRPYHIRYSSPPIGSTR